MKNNLRGQCDIFKSVFVQVVIKTELLLAVKSLCSLRMLYKVNFILFFFLGPWHLLFPMFTVYRTDFGLSFQVTNKIIIIIKTLRLKTNI